MIDLIQKVTVGEILKTGTKPKLPLKLPNITSETLDVYRIPLDFPYYNNVTEG